MKSKPNTIALMTAYALTVIWLFASQGVQAETIPNGRIVYADSTGAFHVLDLSTGNITPVPVPEANPPWDFQATPSWSRDGNYIAFRGGYNFHSQLYVMRPDGSAFSDGAIIHRITDGSGDWGDQSLSPDGRQLAFHNGLSLQLATLDCGLDLETCMNRTPVTHGSGVHAAWSPVGNQVAYSTWPAYEANIYVLDLTTNSTSLITSFPHQGTAFIRVTWSPDGTQIVVDGLDRGTSRHDLWKMSMDGTNPINLTSDWPDSDESYPSWSSDGQHIVFSSMRSGNWDIWSMSTDGADRTNLTNSPEDEFTPSIGPPNQTDCDDDGLVDIEDSCECSNMSATIGFAGCETGVVNEVFGDGCSMLDLIGQCAEGAANHGEYVRCVGWLAIEWMNTALITGVERGRIMRCVADGERDRDGKNSRSAGVGGSIIE